MMDGILGFGTSRKTGLKPQDSMSKEGQGFNRDGQLQQKGNVTYIDNSKPGGRGGDSRGGGPRGSQSGESLSQ